MPITSIIETLGFSLLTAYLVTMIVIVFAGVILARNIVQPIQELALASRQMYKGDFSVRVSVSGTEEQRILSKTFNQLATSLQNQMNQLRQQTKALEESNRELDQTYRFLESILA